ncbi:MAG: molybdenum cofactor biosynthesis protein B, partial [Phycisphaerae bacterium]
MREPDDHAKRIDSVTCAVVTVSDTRTPETDKSGALIRERLESAGHRVFSYEILPDEPSQVRSRVLALCGENACQAVLLTGGTGLARRDTTYEAISAILEKELDGFGELFRMLSYEEIGPAAILSRATAGVCR